MAIIVVWKGHNPKFSLNINFVSTKQLSKTRSSQPSVMPTSTSDTRNSRLIARNVHSACWNCRNMKNHAGQCKQNYYYVECHRAAQSQRHQHLAHEQRLQKHGLHEALPRTNVHDTRHTIVKYNNENKINFSILKFPSCQNIARRIAKLG